MGVIARVTKVNLIKTDCSKHIIKGVVYAPGILDSQGDWMDAETIETMAYNFMKSKSLDHVDTHHSNEPEARYICESYIAQKSDPDDYPEGAWVVAIKIEDLDIWAEVENGDIGGLSLYGHGQSIENVEPPAV
jgi:hypothetical protein